MKQNTRTPEQIKFDLMDEYGDIQNLIASRPSLENEDDINNYVMEIFNEQPEIIKNKIKIKFYKDMREIQIKINDTEIEILEIEKFVFIKGYQNGLDNIEKSKEYLEKLKEEKDKLYENFFSEIDEINEQIESENK